MMIVAPLDRALLFLYTNIVLSLLFLSCYLYKAIYIFRIIFVTL